MEVVQLDSLPVGTVAADFGQAPTSQSSEATHNVNELHSGAMLLALSLIHILLTIALACGREDAESAIRYPLGEIMIG